MSRSGYIDDYENLALYRGQVASAMRGRRGQSFLKEMLLALDTLPEKRLIKNDLEEDGEVCAIGAVGKARGLDMAELDSECPERVASTFGIADCLAREIFWENDECGRQLETPEQRFERVRAWVISSITPPSSPQGGET